MCTNFNEEILYAASKEGVLQIVSLKNEKTIKTIKTTSNSITSINIYHDDFYLLLTDCKGRIIIQNSVNDDRKELRQTCKEGQV